MDSFIKLSNFGKIAPYAQLFRQGLLVTVLLSLFTVAIGFVLALILALMRMSNIRPFRALAVDRNGHLREGGPLVWLSKFNPLSFIATAYVEILRSTPVLVQIFIIYYGVRNDRSSIIPAVWIYQIQSFLPGCCCTWYELRRISLRDHASWYSVY